MIPAAFASVASHLWQSTLFASVAGLLALTLRSNRAGVRYRLWLAASYKFLVPFSLLVSLGHHFEWRAAPATMPPAVAHLTDAVSGPLFLTSSPAVVAAPNHASLIPLVIWLVWTCGCLTVVACWSRQWLRVRAIVRSASPLALGLPIPLPIKVVSTSARLEPGVFGLFRPVLLLPEGIAARLTHTQLEAILAHELCHVRRRDNLAAAVHMLVEALFWFYPLVWWLGSRMVDERESACDEEVLRAGGEAQVYAESIVKVCEFYLESPLACVSGVTGSDLKKRIRRIMTSHFGAALTARKKILLAAAAVASLALPIVAGALNAPRLQTQPSAVPTDRPKFDVASIKLNKSGSPVQRVTPFEEPGGRITAMNSTVRFLITVAYALPLAPQTRTTLLGPNWIDSEHFDIEAETEGNPSEAQKVLMLQSLLADRFKLMMHHETRELPVYALVLAKSGKMGPQLHLHVDDAKCLDVDSVPLPKSPADVPDAAPPMPCNNITTVGGATFYIAGGNVTLQELAKSLGYLRGIDRAVVDRTGLSGNFDVRLDYTPQLVQAAQSQPDASAAPDVFTALEEELGLKLVPITGPVDVIVIDHVEEPSPN